MNHSIHATQNPNLYGIKILTGAAVAVGMVILAGCSSNTQSEVTAPIQSVKPLQGTPNPAAIQNGQSRSINSIQNNPNLSAEQKKRMSDAISGKSR